jgi:hypothetical protein
MRTAVTSPPSRSFPDAHTQARSLDEVAQRIREAIELCLEAEGAPDRSPEFIGIQRITVGSMSRRPRITRSNLLTALAKVSQLLAQATAAHQISQPLDILEFPYLKPVGGSRVP